MVTVMSDDIKSNFFTNRWLNIGYLIIGIGYNQGIGNRTADQHIVTIVTLLWITHTMVFVIPQSKDKSDVVSKGLTASWNQQFTC